MYSSTAFAYTRVLLNASDPNNATSTQADGVWAQWGSTSQNFAIVIDCKYLGVSEIASTTLWLGSTTGSPVMALWEDVTNAKSNSNTITTTYKAHSFVFTPPIWCEGTNAILHRGTYATAPVVIGFPLGPSRQEGKGLYIRSKGGTQRTKLQTASKKDFRPAMWIDGSYSTSTGGGSATYNNSTTTVNVDFDETNTILLTFGLLATLAGSGIFAYNMVYGRRRTT